MIRNLPSAFRLLIFIAIATLLICSCQNRRPPWQKKETIQVPAIDTALFVEVLKEKLAQQRDGKTLDINGAKIYANRVISSLYEKNAYLPLWKNRGMYQAYLKILDSIHLDGLLSDDYAADIIKDSFAEIDTAEFLDHSKLSDLDIITTNSFLLLTLHLLEGKSQPELLDPNWNYHFTHIDKHSVDSVYRTLSHGDVLKYFQQIKQRSDYYLGMQTTLKKLYQLKLQGGWGTISHGKDLKLEPGDDDPVVLDIRKRLAFPHIPSHESTVYDSLLVNQVIQFQSAHGLTADGVIGSATIEALNIPVEDKIDKVRVNLERARWLINDLVQKRIVVNIANFSAYLIDSNQIVHTSKVMVGKPFSKTPIFESTLKYIEFNPTWTVPNSILRNEMLPIIRNDSSYLSKRNMSIINSQGKSIPIETVDLSGSFPYSVRQGPGPSNALGRVKFIFPNAFSVYLHDTPSRHLFGRSERAFSHGCIRLENPLKWAELLINEKEWDQSGIDKVIREGKTLRVFPQKDIRVMIIYFTHLTDLDGIEYFYPDIYDRDEAVLQVLNAPIDESVLEYQSEKITSQP